MICRPLRTVSFTGKQIYYRQTSSLNPLYPMFTKKKLRWISINSQDTDRSGERSVLFNDAVNCYIYTASIIGELNTLWRNGGRIQKAKSNYSDQNLSQLWNNSVYYHSFRQNADFTDRYSYFSLSICCKLAALGRIKDSQSYPRYESWNRTVFKNTYEECMASSLIC